MQRTFKNKKGEEFAPSHFAIYTNKKGNTFAKVQSELNIHDFDEYEDIKTIELYENGTENLSPLQVDKIYNERLNK